MVKKKPCGGGWRSCVCCLVPSCYVRGCQLILHVFFPCILKLHMYKNEDQVVWCVYGLETCVLTWSNLSPCIHIMNW
jgi:hypothetical protein